MAEILSFPPKPTQPPDVEARRQALDIRRSFIVEAPAGSGKTGLLIQRFLKLLADDSVEQPEQVLAITFTLKATAEMRDRVISHLAAAQESKLEHIDNSASSVDFKTQTFNIAKAVLVRDRQLGWNLLDHPYRLNIRTIDSVCAEIARTLPILSGSGGRLTPADDAEPLHREAARRTLLLLGTGDPTFDQALRDLLLHRDGNLADCESLLANMLSLRDQWGDLIPLTGPQLDDAWLDANVLPRLELALNQAICAELTRLVNIFPTDLLAELTSLTADLAPAAPYDPATPSPIAHCTTLRTPPTSDATDIDHWLALFHILTTSSGELRKERGVNSRNLKFDYNRKHYNHTRLSSLLDALQHRDDILLAMQKVQALPPAHYPADQWTVAKSLFRVLSRALVELQFVFAARNQCDFTEFSLLARHALASDSGADDLSAALGARLQHLLVDEMQDTSTSQYELIELLTSSWDGCSQTVFLVGDPRQSIYLFRQARVERFIHAMHTQLLGDLPLTRLRLTANFRSQSVLVEQLNQDFNLIFPISTASEALPYTPTEPTLAASAHARATVWHANPITLAQDSTISETITSAQVKRQQARRDAQEICHIAREWIAKPLPSGRDKPWQIAVLVRSRSHLTEIIAALKQDGTIPFRAVEIEALDQRQEILDLTALTRALFHPADRVAVLAVLRAPWCGLSLADLHTLTGADAPTLQFYSIQQLIAERGDLLSNDGIQRLQRIWKVLSGTISQRARLTAAQLVERAWRSLGGDSYIDQLQLTNINNFFCLLDKLQVKLEENFSALLLDPAALSRHLKKLYAEPNWIPDGTPFVELLTIHKAKGLEWDVVIVPALERGPGRNATRLLTWSEVGSSNVTENSAGDRAAHVMLAPIAGRGEPSRALNNWLNGIHNAREAAERKRLFYVACTRAREELHLFAAPQLSSKGMLTPPHSSLLQAAWPAAEAHFAVVNPAPETAENIPGAPLIGFDLAASTAPSRHSLQRLPLSFDPAEHIAFARTHKLPYGEPDSVIDSSQPQFSRPEGSFAARAFGNAVHASLEYLANRIASGQSPTILLDELPSWTPRISALLRSDGLPAATVNRLTRETRTALETVLHDPDGLWLLALHTGAANEFSVTAWSLPEADRQTPARLSSIRVDRVFYAGSIPQAPGDDVLWIIDYKTTTPIATDLEVFLAAQRNAYATQLETYARILTQPQAPAQTTAKEVRLALYYPLLSRLVWWPYETAPA